MANLMQFDYEIRYKKGKENMVVDAFSKCGSGEINNLTSVVLSAELMDKITQGWQEDPHQQAIIVAKAIDPTTFSKYE